MRHSVADIVLAPSLRPVEEESPGFAAHMAAGIGRVAVVHAEVDTALVPVDRIAAVTALADILPVEAGRAADR